MNQTEYTKEPRNGAQRKLPHFYEANCSRGGDTVSSSRQLNRKACISVGFSQLFMGSQKLPSLLSREWSFGD